MQQGIKRTHDEADDIPLITGSIAEFYIEPMLPSHIGDVDVMYYQNTLLAIPRGHPPPTHGGRSREVLRRNFVTMSSTTHSSFIIYCYDYHRHSI